MKCSVFIATSLDGYIARSDGSIDWLEQANQLIPAGEDCGYAAFMESIDALVMGRHTFEKKVQFSKWPYTKPVIVLSTQAIQVPENLKNHVFIYNLAPTELVKHLAAQGYQHLYIDGGLTIQRFLAAKLINEITLTLIPTLLGEGKRLFAPNYPEQTLALVDSKMYPFGFLQLKYSTS